MHGQALNEAIANVIAWHTEQFASGKDGLPHELVDDLAKLVGPNVVSEARRIGASRAIPPEPKQLDLRLDSESSGLTSEGEQ